MSRHVEIDTPIRPAEEAASHLGLSKSRFKELVEMVRGSDRSIKHRPAKRTRAKVAANKVTAKNAAKR